MKKANLERSATAKVTGHRNPQSLDDYDEADNVQQRSLSRAISKRNAQRGETSSSMCLTRTKIPLMRDSQSHAQHEKLFLKLQRHIQPFQQQAQDFAHNQSM